MAYSPRGNLRQTEFPSSRGYETLGQNFIITHEADQTAYTTVAERMAWKGWKEGRNEGEKERGKVRAVMSW